MQVTTMDPFVFFAKHQHLNLVWDIAADILSVPVGEAPSGRILSIAVRIMRGDRCAMDADTLSDLTFAKKNDRALA